MGNFACRFSSMETSMKAHVIRIEHHGIPFKNSQHGILLVTGLWHHYVLFLP
jgi:hypothetical protein